MHGMQSNNKEKSLEFLTHALAEVGFSPAHARRACLATNLAGVPQAIEWALAHLDEESDPQAAQRQQQRYSGGGEMKHGASPNGGNLDNGLVVELPDGKLFRLTNPNGRVVEMPNGAVVEMVDGQVVEMSNGQQLEMVDGSLVEIRPATLALDEGEVVGHRIIEYELSRQIVRKATHNAAAAAISDYSVAAAVGSKSREIQMREEQLEAQALSLSERDKAVNGKQLQLAQHQQGLRAQEEGLGRQRAHLQVKRACLRSRV